MIDQRVNLLVSTIVRVVIRETLPHALFGDPHLNLMPDKSRSAENPGEKPKTAAQRRVLVVDDETVITDSVAMILNRGGYAAEAK